MAVIGAAALLLATALLQDPAGPSAAPSAGSLRASFAPDPNALLAVTDGRVPRSSGDSTVPRQSFFDHKGGTEWLEVDFGAERQLNGTRVYWADDGGGIRLPLEWRILYRSGKRWLRVKRQRGSRYEVEADRFNAIRFQPVATSALRLEVDQRPDASAGVLEWEVLGVGGEFADAVQPTSSETLARRVDRAVDRGVAWLKSRQRADGGFGPFDYHEGRRYEAGYTAIAVLALVSSGINNHDPLIDRAVEYLLSHPPRYTYEIGLTMQALDMRAAPPNERFELARMDPGSRREYRWPRTLTGPERALMASCLEQLSTHRFHGLWSYATDPDTADVSNSQFAVLGLKAASRCGLAVSGDLFCEVIRYYLDHVTPVGEKSRVPVFKGLDRNGEPTFYRMRLQPRGWGYRYGQRDEIAGSHVNIGIASLLLCQEEILRKGVKGRLLGGTRRRRGEIGEAVEAGLAWLATHYSVRKRPPVDAYYYYYMYSLERVGVLTDREYIGEHPWYDEGAEELLLRQREDGSWPGEGWSQDLPNTCFALLFLRRATVPPVLTGGG